MEVKKVKAVVRLQDAKKKAILAAKWAADKKAEEIVVLDMRKAANFCDYFVICTASSQRRAGTIADFIEGQFEERGIKLRSSEGRREGVWILLDFADIVIHIFFQDVRPYYQLERLWADAKVVNVPRRREKNTASSEEEH